MTCAEGMDLFRYESHAKLIFPLLSKIYHFNMAITTYSSSRLHHYFMPHVFITKIIVLHNMINLGAKHTQQYYANNVAYVDPSSVL